MSLKLKERFDKLIGGIQIQNRKSNRWGIGTLGCIVYDNDTNMPLGLTNKHILRDRIGTTVIQPARSKRNHNFIIGEVFRKGGKGEYNDFAVFKINAEYREVDSENSFVGLTGKVTQTVLPQVGMKVQKIGQKTGHTFGIIYEVEPSLGYFKIKPNPSKLNGQISKGGDSGSIWLTDEDDFKAVGIHISGEKQPNFFRRRRPDRATAINIDKVLDSLNVRL